MFSGSLEAFNSFNGQLTLACAGSSLPSTCSVDPPQMTPAAATTPLAVTAGGAVGNYSFNLVGTGAGLSRNSPLTLQVVDFTLGTPSPAAVSVALGADSSPVTMPLNFLGSFPASGTISLSCNGPAGLSCNFFPSSSIAVSEGPTVPVTLTIAAAAGAPSGSSTVAIMAASADAGSKTVNQSLSVTVTGSEGYSLTLNPPAGATAVRQTVSVPGAVTGINGYSSAVQLSCVNGATPPP
jgi:hypothetical protein